MKRRTFIQQASYMATGTIFIPGLLSCANRSAQSVGIQLYTLKDVISKDVRGTLKKVADIGFKELELYSYSGGKIFGLPYNEFNTLASDLGLTVVSGHYSTGYGAPDMKGTLANDWERAVEDAKNAGQKYMAIAWLHPHERQTLDAYKKVCALMNQANEVCRQAGVILAYHNHEFEFEPVEGRIPYDVMCEELDESVALELDIYWSTFAHFDTLELFKKYSGRIQLWHVKDMDRNKREQSTDVGSGSIDYKPIFKAADISGMKHFFLEQEYFTTHPMEAIAKGYSHLRGII
jgi:sugar phosphate isomerase/epimerase